MRGVFFFISFALSAPFLPPPVFFFHLPPSLYLTLFSNHRPLSLSLSLSLCLFRMSPKKTQQQKNSLAQVLPFVLAWSLFAALFLRSTTAAAVLALFALAAALPAGSRWPAVIHSRVWDCWRRRFRYCGVVPGVPYTKPGEQYVFGHFPHTCFPMGSFLSFPLCGDAATGVPGPMQALVATVLLRVPLYKHVFAWLGCHPADKPVMLDLLKENSVGVIVEGVAGIFLGPTKHEERVYLRKRKGFVKAAIQAGKGKTRCGWECGGEGERGGGGGATGGGKHFFLFSTIFSPFSSASSPPSPPPSLPPKTRTNRGKKTDLVPVYHLGTAQLLTFSGPGKLSRRARASLGLLWGTAGLPLPRRSDIISLVGEPIPVERDEDPSQELIDETHRRFCEALVRLFDQHKHLLGKEWEYKELQIV